MQEYAKGARIILDKGFRKDPARAGMVGTRSYESLQLRFDLSKGTIPILTTKDMEFRHIVAELLWFLKGDTNIVTLKKVGCNIWDQNAYDWFLLLKEQEQIPIPMMTKEEFLKDVMSETPQRCIRSNGRRYVVGDLGLIYGYQWRHRKLDQIRKAVYMLANQPESRQNKVVAWVPEDMTYEFVAQPNCHGDFTITARKLNGEARIKLLKERLKRDNLTMKIDEINGQLDAYNIPKYEFTINLNQRSGDYALGIPYNIASYGLMAYIFGILTNTIPKMLIMTITDAHVYNDHIDTLRDQINRTPNASPTFTIRGNRWETLASSCREETKDIDTFLEVFKVDDFQLIDYKPATKVKYKLHTGTLTKKK